jgi:hypothetical protein
MGNNVTYLNINVCVMYVINNYSCIVSFDAQKIYFLDYFVSELSVYPLPQNYTVYEYSTVHSKQLCLLVIV